MPDLSRSDAEQLIAWLQTKSSRHSGIPPELENLYIRATQADRWMREFMSVSIVKPMLAKHFGYSEATALRDIQLAQETFGVIESHPKQYYAKLMIDKIGESIMQAVSDRKWREVAALSKEIREWLGFAESLGVQDPRLLLNEVPRYIVFDPSLLGVDRNPNILQEAQRTIEEKLGKPFPMPRFPEEGIADTPEDG